MTNANPHVSLPEKDYLKVIDIIHRLYRCETQGELLELIKAKILPLLQVQGFNASWMDMDLNSQTLGVSKPLCQVGFNKKEVEIGMEIMPYHKEIAQKIATSMRPVLAYGVDVPEESLQSLFNEFFKDHPHYNREDYPLHNTIKNGIIIVDPPDFNIGIGFTRQGSSSEPLTYKEMRLAELLQPSLIRTLKCIAVNQELKTYRSLVDTLARVSTPLSLIHPQGLIAFCNGSFQKVANLGKGDFLPEALTALLKQKEEAFNASENPESPADSLAFFKFPGGDVRCSWTRLSQPGTSEDGCWLLKLKPVTDPYSQALLAMQQAGLTPREIEVATRVCDGIEDSDIAERLFISPQTVKNHLKSIYQKLDVHSRTQLVARLRPSAEELEL